MKRKKSKRRWSSAGMTEEGRRELNLAHLGHRNALGNIARTFGTRRVLLQAEHHDAIRKEQERANADIAEIVEADRKRREKLEAEAA